jgi:integrase
MPRPKKPIRAERISPHDLRFRVSFLGVEGSFVAPYEDRDRALAWAERNKDALIAKRSGKRQFRELAQGFFDRGGAWDKDQVQMGWTRTDATLAIYQGFLENNFLPYFGDYDIYLIDAPMVKLAVAGFVKINGEPYARATRNKMRYALGLMFTYWISTGALRASNPVDSVEKYNKAPEKPRSALPRDVLDKLCPPTHGAAVKLYGSAMYACFFFAMNDTGARPGELRALRWGQIDYANRFVAIRTAVEAGKSDKIKTTKTGKVRPAYFSERTIQELKIWREEAEHADDMDFIFLAPHRTKPVSQASTGKAFEKALKLLGYEGKDWTPYYIRHSFGTYKMEILPQPDIERLMGHASSVTTEGYQHPDDETVRLSGIDIQRTLEKNRKNTPKA